MNHHHNHHHTTRTTLIIGAAIIIIIIGGLYFWRKNQSGITCMKVCTTNANEEKECADICVKE